MPQVSVVMPVLRTPERLLREAIDSIIAQTLTDWELIIVEDPSDAVSTDVIRSYNDDRIRHVLNESRTGLVRQRNQGLSLAQSPLIVKADSDDISEPDRLDKQAQYLAEHSDIGLVGSFLTIIDSDGNVTGRRTYPTDPSAIRTTMRRRNVIAQPAACFRRELFDQFGGYPEGYPVCQDYAYWSQLAKQGVRFANLPEELVRYRQHGGSIKSTRLIETLDATLRIKRTYWGDELTFADRGRMLCERLLKQVPAGWTHWLFTRITYQRRR